MSFEENESNLFFGHFFFVDIIDSSNPDISTKIQLKKVYLLNKFIAESPAYSTTPKENTIIVSTGDGICIGFLQGPDLPLKLALQLHEKLDQFNKGRLAADTIQVL